MPVDQEALIEPATIPEMELRKLVSEAERALVDRKPWEYKLRDAYTRRYGIRGEKTFPWKGCANLHIPITDKIIRRLQPTLQSAIFRVSPIVTIEPLGNMQENTAKALERGYDWLVRYNMDGPQEEMIFVEDAMLTYGMAVLKVCWEYDSEIATRTIDAGFFDEVDREAIPVETARLEIVRRLGLDPQEHTDEILDAMRQFYDGAEKIGIELEKTNYDGPRWWYIAPEDCIVPWDSGTNVDRLPWIIHRMQKTRREIEIAKKSGRYDADAADAVLKGMHKVEPKSFSEEIDARKRWREGLIGSSSGKSSTSEIWEIYFLYDRDGDGVCEKYVTTYSVSTKKFLRTIPFEYEHGEWPFTRFSFETTEPRWYSPRGVPEMIRDIQIEINANHNSWLDSMAIKNAPSFIYRAGSIKDSNWRFRPGAGFPTQRGPSDVAPINFPHLDFSYNQQEEVLRAWAEEFIGTPDFGISNINQRVERRTATEVEQIQASTGAIADALLERFQMVSMRRVHRQTLFLHAQYGDEQVLIRVTGSDDVVNFVKYDIYRDYDLVPTGRLDNLSPQMRVARVGTLVQLGESPVYGPSLRPQAIVEEIVGNLYPYSSEKFLAVSGELDTDAAQKQITEISNMATIGAVWEVDVRDPHQIHIQVCLQAAQANQDDPDLVQLIAAHMAVHLSLLPPGLGGNRQLLDQLVTQGAQVQQVGTKIRIALPQPEQQQPETTEDAA